MVNPRDTYIQRIDAITDKEIIYHFEHALEYFIDSKEFAEYMVNHIIFREFYHVNPQAEITDVDIQDLYCSEDQDEEEKYEVLVNEVVDNLTLRVNKVCKDFIAPIVFIPAVTKNKE